MQKLLMPFKKSMMLCGYKNPRYKEYWGYQHYGIDISTIQGGAGDDHTIYASGNGVVVAAGKDSKLGYAVAVLYPQVFIHQTGETKDLIARYMHMNKLYCKVGDQVKLGDWLAQEGKEGTGDYHLHLEFDTDINYPTYTPQVAKRAGAFWQKGVDTTVNPSFVLHRSEDYDTVKPTYNPDWLNSEDFSLPIIMKDKPTDWEAEYRKLKAEDDALKAEYSAFKDSIRQLMKKYGAEG